MLLWLACTSEVPAPGWDMGVTVRDGAVTVVSVAPEGAAARAGLLPGDRLLAYNREDVDALEDLTPPGEWGTLDVLRLGRVEPLFWGVLPHPLVGQTAPELALTRLSDGAPVTLASMRGRVVVLDFWASWCEPCVAAMPQVNALVDRYPASKLSVLSVALQPAEGARPLAASLRSEVLLADPSEAERLYLLSGIPAMVVIDPQGQVLSLVEGAEAISGLDAQLKQLLGS